MSELARTLTDLLEGDFVRLDAGELSVRTEVVGVDRTVVETADGRRARRCTIRFMPIGDDATAVPADRYRVTVEPAADGFRIGDLIAEIYVEEDLDYRSEPRGPVADIELFDVT